VKKFCCTLAAIASLNISIARSQDSGAVRYSDTEGGAYGEYVRTGRIAPVGPTFEQLGSNLATYIGEPLNVAIDHFGYPDDDREIAGRKLYVWAVNEIDSVPDLATTTGTIGDQQFSATTFGGANVNMTAHCKITMAVDGHNIVRDVRYDGNMAGCFRFMAPAIRAQELAQSPRPSAAPALDASTSRQRAARPDGNLELRDLVARAQAATQRGDFLTPQGSSAYDLYVRALAIDGNNPGALQGLQALPKEVTKQFNQALSNGNLGQATDMLDNLSQLAPGEASQGALSERLAGAWLDQAEQQLGSGDRIGAVQSLERARKLSPYQPRVLDLSTQLQNGP
jgi:hypothetical protein